MRTSLSVTFASLMVISMIGAPIAYKRWCDRQFRNFHVVEEGVLFRSGQLSIKRLEQVVAEHGIRTVINLRDGEYESDRHEETWVKSRGLNFVRIPHQSWDREESGRIPAENVLAAFRKVMDDPNNHPVLVHCLAGIHRTGTMVAIFRIDYQGWTNAEAMAEMRVMGYTVYHENVVRYFTTYQPPVRPKSIPAMTTSYKKNPLP